MSLSAQWKIGFPGEERLLKDIWQKPIPTDTTLAFFPGRHSKNFQEETYSNLVRQNAITHQLDSVIYEGFSDNTSQWVGTFRSAFKYNAEERLEAETVEYFNEFLHVWEYSDKFSYTYNNDQQLVQLLYNTWDTEIADWVKKYKYVYVYDLSMRLSQEIRYYWDEDTNSWYGSSKDSFTYTQSDQIETEIYSSWNEIYLWVEMYRDEYDYDDNKLIESRSSEKYNPNDEWNYTYRTVLAYDSLGQLSYEYKYAFQDNGDWRLYARLGYSYDAQGNVLQELLESWYVTDSLWHPISLYQYTYEDGHETSYFRYDWNSLDQNWEGTYGGTAAYSAYGDITERVDLDWDEMLMEWVQGDKTEYNYDLTVDFANVLWPYPDADPSDLFHRMPTSLQFYGYEGDWILEDSVLLRYSIPTSALTLAVEPLTMSPNPAHDFIQFSIPGIQKGSTLNVYSPEGKLMISTSTFENTQVSISSLSPGWYIARIQNGKDLYIGKFVKE